MSSDRISHNRTWRASRDGVCLQFDRYVSDQRQTLAVETYDSTLHIYTPTESLSAMPVQQHCLDQRLSCRDRRRDMSAALCDLADRERVRIGIVQRNRIAPVLTDWDLRTEADTS
jgi:hypothetical protein